MGQIEIPRIGFNPPTYHCKRATKPFTLDGNMFKEFWMDAPWTSDFIDIQGKDIKTPHFKTQAKMLWDDKNFYFGAVLYGDEIWGSITERDSVIFYDNDFEIFIDPDSDTHGYFEYEMNVLNTVWDLFLTKPYRDTGGRPLNGWDIHGLRSAVHVEGEINNPSGSNKYWSVEVVIPFEALIEMSATKAPPRGGEYYRVNFSRVQWNVDREKNIYVKRQEPEENWVWAPTGVINIHYPELWGFVFFVDEDSTSATNPKEAPLYAIPEEELLAWQLRRIYYYEHRFFEEHGRFTNSIEQLRIPSFSMEPHLEATKNNFEASLYTTSGERLVRIHEDGRVEKLSTEESVRFLRRPPSWALEEVSPEEQIALEKLYKGLPLSDLSNLGEFPEKSGDSSLDMSSEASLDSPEILDLLEVEDKDPLKEPWEKSHRYFINLVKQAFRVRKEMPWGAEISDSDFYEFVLPPRINNEHLEPYHKMFYNELKPRVATLSRKEAAVEVNFWCFEKATYQSTSIRTGSPLTIVKRAFGRCGEESTLLVAALRSVGIPARQCYVPRWSHSDDNHAWVEVQTEDGWEFLGACEPEIELNRGWFVEPASRAMLIQCHGIWGKQNILRNYAKTKELSIRVLNPTGTPVEGALVEFQLVNYSQYSTIKSIRTNREGEVSFTTGYGDLLAILSHGSLSAETLIPGSEEGVVEITLGERDLTQGVREFIMHPPLPPTLSQKPLSCKQKELENQKKERALEIRKTYESTFISDRGTYLEGAKGNYQEIQLFLQRAGGPEELEWREKLLSTLEEKDLVDTTAATLEDHFLRSMPYKEAYKEDLFLSHIMAPQVGIEKITPYREAILKNFDPYRTNIEENPLWLWKWMQGNLGVVDLGEINNLSFSPAEMLASGIANSISRVILFVSTLRTFGIMAALRRGDLLIEYFHNGSWQLCTKEGNPVPTNQATLILEREEGSLMEPYKSFTLSSLKNNRWESLHHHYRWENNRSTLHVESGCYRTVITKRDPLTGDLTVRVEQCILEDQDTKTIYLKPIERKLQGLNLQISHKDIERDGVHIWLNPTEEPSIHVLHELMELREQWHTKSLPIFAIVQNQGYLENPLVVRTKKSLSEQVFHLKVGSADPLTPLYAKSGVAEELPLILVVQNGVIVAAWSGYQVGVAQQIVEELPSKE